MTITCSTMAVANYMIGKLKKSKLKISKTKLQNMLAKAHITHVIKFGKPLVTEKLRLMHFGFLFKSIAGIFNSLKYDEDIGSANYAEVEKALNIKLREKTIDTDLADADLAAAVKAFLDEIIKEFATKDERASAYANIKPGSPWDYVANKIMHGSHLITDMTAVTNKELYALKGKCEI